MKAFWQVIGVWYFILGLLIGWCVGEFISISEIRQESRAALLEYYEASSERYEARTHSMIDQIEREYEKARGE